MLCLCLMSAGVICNCVCCNKRGKSKQHEDSVDWNYCVIGRVCKFAIKVCLLDLHKQMHISKPPPRYWQQDACLGTGTRFFFLMCVYLCSSALVCVRVWVAHAWLSGSFQDLVNRADSPYHIATECAVAPASVSFSGTHALILLPWRHTDTRAFLSRATDTRTHAHAHSWMREWQS